MQTFSIRYNAGGVAARNIIHCFQGGK